MKLIIQTPHFEAQQKLLAFAEDHVRRLQLVNERIIEAHICLKLDKSDKKENKISEIKLVVPGNDLFASKQSNSFEDAIQQSVSALRRQLERWKTNHEQRAEKAQ